MSNSLDPDQARHFVGPDLYANCLQRLMADATGRGLVNNQVIDFKCCFYKQCRPI